MEDSQASEQTGSHSENRVFTISSRVVDASSENREKFAKGQQYEMFPWTNWTEAALSILRLTCHVSDKALQGFIDIVNHPDFDPSHITGLHTIKVRQEFHEHYISNFLIVFLEKR